MNPATASIADNFQKATRILAYFCDLFATFARHSLNRSTKKKTVTPAAQPNSITFFEQRCIRKAGVQTVWVVTLCLSFVFASLSKAAPPDNVYFSKIEVDGLDSLSAIVAIEQDHQGFLWFGGKNGLARFDGYKTVNFRHNPEDPHSLNSNHINDLHIDNQGTLWVAMHSSGGLSRYNAKTDNFTHFRLNPRDSNSLGSKTVYAIAEDQKGKLWLAVHGGGIIKFDPESKAMTQFKKSANESGPSDDTIRDIAFAADGTLWVATASQGLYHFDPESRLFRNYRHSPTRPKQPGNEQIKQCIYR